MDARQQTTAKPSNALGPPQASTGFPLLQRKCACGGSSSMAGNCPECEKNKLLSKPLQAKLAISEPGDQYEQEADHVAEQVMRMREPVPGKNVRESSTTLLVQRKVNDTGAGIGTAPPIVHDVLNSPGQPLDATTRAFFEPRFGHDFSQVRVHYDAQAVESARAIDAEAYTNGEHIIIESSKLTPGSYSGRKLLAHELVHVVQQSGSAEASGSRLVFRHTKDKTKCLGDLDWKRIDASPQAIYTSANDVIENAYKSAHGSNAILTGSQFESGGKPGSAGIQLPKGAPNKSSCNKLLSKYLGVSRQLAPDIMDCSERVFYEIKTNRYAGKGAEQVLSYYKLANEYAAQDGEVPWQIEAAGWYPPHVLMLEPTRRVCTEGTDYERTQRPGLIIYEVQDHKDRKQKKEQEKQEEEKKTTKSKEQEAAEKLQKSKLRKVKEFVDQLEREVDLQERDNRAQLNLINDPSYVGFWGYWTNELFNTQPPLTMIWNNAYGLIAAARTQLRAGDPVKALERFLEARVAYLEALKQYKAWKEKLPGAGAKMQTAIVVSAVVALAAFVAPSVVARAASSASSGAGTAANLVAAENAVTQAGVRIAAGEAQMAAIEAAIEEEILVTEAGIEAEEFVLQMLKF